MTSIVKQTKACVKTQNNKQAKIHVNKNTVGITQPINNQAQRKQHSYQIITNRTTTALRRLHDKHRLQQRTKHAQHNQTETENRHAKSNHEGNPLASDQYPYAVESGRERHSSYHYTKTWCIPLPCLRRRVESTTSIKTS